MTTAAACPAPVSARMPLAARAWRVGKRLVRVAALMYVLVALGMYFLQTYLIFPGTFRQGAPDAVVKPGTGEELVPLRAADGTQLMGLFGLADKTPSTASQHVASLPKPTVLYFYGNAGEMNTALYEFDLFRRHGVHCMLVDYAGFGMSGGKASEQGCCEAAEAAYHYVLSRPDVDKTHLIAAGWSLGAAVAIDLVHRHRTDQTFCGLLTFSAFSSMVDMGKRNYPFLPISLLLKHRFLSEDKLREITVPFFLAHGQADPAIPFAMSDRLAAAYGGGTANLTRYSHSQAGHNDFFDVGGAELERAIGAFLQKITRE